jgi:hypothetical protein
MTVRRLRCHCVTAKNVSSAAPTTISGMIIGRYSRPVVVDLPRNGPPLIASAAIVPKVVAIAVVIAPMSRLLPMHSRMSSACQRAAYQRSENPSQMEIFRDRLNENTTRIAMGT